MTLILSGTNGLSDVDGSAATPAIRGTDANTGIFFPAADTIAFSEGGAEVARFDSSGNLGIGTSSPSYPLHVVGNTNGNVTNGVTNSNSGTDAAARFIAIADAGSAVFGMTSSGYTGITGAQDALLLNANTASGGIAFALDGVLKAKIDSSGNLLVNTTSPNGGEKMSLWYSSNTGPGLTIRDTSAQNGNTFIQFRNGTTTAGSITSNGSTTMTYGSASDYRLKENLTPLAGALAKIAALQPKVGNWKADGSEFVGFVAHELQEVFPDAVVGEKDRVDADGNPLHQMVDTGSASIIATLAAAIQELNAKVETLQAEVTALKGVQA
ncbi:Intramolecular chaperone auto-processing domain containing protein [uncultured Caudovirales phage]|uniref:Intramolecular chaperone auto-processing domain containing protein n=1 Tax=uncultured Caudovirales phage TaxID=2100421 RepID=A0A6J5NFS6_9CAUD|nr:Intramolecular chaperone auto-processing domain containing protein [uncultured Caudovirales phage]